jgi:hypothetical protein
MRKLKIQHLSLCFLGILAIVAVSTSRVAKAADDVDAEYQVDLSKSDVRQCIHPGAGGHGGGGEIPNPLLSINQHVELAVGEFYSLIGTVIAGSDNPNATAANSVPMFAVDLQQHPWLANVQRVRSPYYFLSGGWPFWGRYLQKRVLITVQARVTLITRPNGDRYSEIVLQVVDSGSVTPANQLGPKATTATP